MLQNYCNMFILISDIAKILDTESQYNWQINFHSSLKQLYSDMEIDYKYKEKIKKVESLLYTMCDIFDKYAPYNIPIDEKKERLENIYKSNQVTQRTEEWYNDSKKMLTASEFHVLFESERTRGLLVMNKLNINKRESQKAVATGFMTPFDWGIRFEPVVKQYLESIWKCKIYDCGRLKHKENNRLGASPDGIIIDCEDSERFGRLLEIKCPYTRKIKDIVPFEYWVQMQIQMEVSNLIECEYVEMEIISSKPKELNIDLSGDYIYKNTMYLLQKDNILVYAYTVEERDKYFTDGYDLFETIPYAISKVNNILVKRDTGWYKSTIDLQNKFWEDVENNNFVVPEPKYKKAKKLNKENDCMISDEK